MAQNNFGPRSWKAADVRNDNSWIQRLSLEEVDGFRATLGHGLQRAIATTQGRWGMCLVKGFPTGEWSEAEMRLLYWEMSLYMGVRRTQNWANEVISDVRNAGRGYKVKGGKGYNTNAGLDFHQDSCDVVALLCRRIAREGGTRKVISSLALRDRVAELRPDLLPVLQNENENWNAAGFCCARTLQKNTVAAQHNFPEEALDLLDTIMPTDEYCYDMDLEPSDMQLLNSFVTLHSRTPFPDYDVPDQKRHLMRLWMSIPTSQPLPPKWAEYWGDVRAGSVRGGFRGSFITPQFLAYENRQAETMKTKFTP
ncbi:hypothetical protein B0H14DRAFT_2949602 [Mycena olivaceomarginata]|nr:hypothetical protein B0H14DRAFT_2949602 [Mycena olivaceomarginata]